jgi:hypothetical protein
MSEADIIKLEYEALMKFCKGDRKMIFKIIQEHGPAMRQYFDGRNPEAVTCEELCALLESITNNSSLS